MNTRKILNMVILAFVLISFLVGGMGRGVAMPMSPVDETKVPHYFGPYPNWANSPFTLPDVNVEITGDGTGATAAAAVGANGSITGIVVTNPGHDYTTAEVNITGAGTGATAAATVVTSGVVTGIFVDTPGAGFLTPAVTISGGGATTDATATAYGSVDAVSLFDGGTGYTFPTVDFDMPDDPNGVQALAHAEWDPTTGQVTAVVLDNPGSGYAKAPGVVIRDGTLADPINNGATGANASATIAINSVVLDTFGAGYTSTPSVTIDDLTLNGGGATAHATIDSGGVTSINLLTGGSGYITPGGIQKFTDQLTLFCDPDQVRGLGPACPDWVVTPDAKSIPFAVPEVKTYNGIEADEYVIGLVQYRMSFSSSLPPSLVRGYVQLETPANAGLSQHFALENANLDPAIAGTPVLINGSQAYAVTPPQYLGPVIVSVKDRPVRIVFYNLLPTGDDGDLFLPVDATIMGSGEAEMSMPYDPVPTTGGDVQDMARNPMCTDARSMGDMCFLKNRATLHLHGGNTPWISDGTPHQWITPAGDSTMWPEGVSVENVPDMDVCNAANDGCQTFYYTNQQSARLMFYHDHAWGITRLNVYAGEAAGYLITDAAEQKLIGAGGAMEGLGVGIPLVIQDKTFVPQPEQLAWQDPTWDASRWGGYGNLWYHHVYMPAQNPGDPGGMSAFGRWMYGPWFWPPAGDAKYGPIANPYYNMDPKGTDGVRGTMDDWDIPLAVPCNLDDPTTWQYDSDPFCEPELIPGTPNISAGMEQFNDTPLVNGVAYPTITVEPKTYRFRILSAANDRFFNFQWYVGEAATASTSLNNLGEVIGPTEVALNAAEVAAAQTDPVVFPTPDLVGSPAGPDWIQIGTEGGFLPAPVVVDGQQVTTWITDPTRFDVGNVDQHSLLLAPAERADVIVDFSQFAGKTLILYNDAPAAFPARIPSYDYYTGAPDLRPVGAPTILPGYGPNTRTIMQVKVAANPPAPSFNLTRLRTAFSHKADGSGVFESGQHPIIVGQSTYNSAYGKSFASSGWCNTTNPGFKCDGFARISQQGGDLFTFDTLRMNSNGTYPTGYGKVSVKIEPKAIHDETNASSFDEFGRMQANLGVEVVPATPGMQNVVLHPYTYPTTEIIDTTGLPTADVQVTPISSGTDGTQIWKITHNGVDTHPIHFHAYDVQLLNRVTWDNIIIPPDLTELGWKDTLRIAPLEDTIVALRPVVPVLPFDLPNSIRLLSPMMPEGQVIDLSSIKDGLGLGMTAFAPSGDPIDVYNHYVNYGAEYVYHCHILSHEEMDMMRPVSLAYPPVAPSDLVIVNGPSSTYSFVDLAWTDNSRSETAWVVQRSADGGLTWSTVATLPTGATLNPDTGRSTGGVVTYSDPVDGSSTSFSYRVQAINVVGDTWNYANPAINEIISGGFPTVTVVSGFTNVVTVGVPAPEAPTSLTAAYSYLGAPQVALAWNDPNAIETGYRVERCTGAGCTNFAQINGDLAADSTSFTDTAVAFDQVYSYRVYAFNASGLSGFSPIATAVMPPIAPTGLTAIFQAATNGNTWLPPRVALAWTDNSATETGYVVERCSGAGCTNFAPLIALAAGSVAYTDTPVSGNTSYSYRVQAMNAGGGSLYSNTASSTTPNYPQAPATLSVTCVLQGNSNARCTLTWPDVAGNTGYTIQRATNATFTAGLNTQGLNQANATTYTTGNISRGTNYYFRIRAFNANGASPWTNATPFPVLTP